MTEHDIRCRPARGSDFRALAEMFRELQAFHGHNLDTLESLEQQLRDAPHHFEIVVAEQESNLLGFALFTTLPGPALRPGIFLKELFVTDASRGMGAGRRLMQELAKLALQRGCRRIDLTTGLDNTRARSFYDQLGGNLDHARVFYRFEADAIAAIAQSAESTRDPSSQ